MSLLKTLSIIFITFFLLSCNSSTTEKKKPETTEKTVKKEVIVPAFNADSALAYVKAQCDFGPRVPGTKTHTECAKWLVSTLNRFTPHVQVQEFKGRVYNGDVFTGKNIIASFKPESKTRIMLCAHWDSRPYADQDPDPSKHLLPIEAANDGASGVGVNMEIARLLSLQAADIGVDIIFFDLEDYGPPQDDQKEGKNEHWAIGSQYWSHNPHIPNYRARFVILLDMVGAPDAVFRQEGFSMHYAPDMVRKVWNVAHSLGYQEYFLNEAGGYINDDHFYVNYIRNIPAIDIIHLDPNSSNGSFFEYWHTSGDTFDKIDKGMLEIVGTVIAEVVYRE